MTLIITPKFMCTFIVGSSINCAKMSGHDDQFLNVLHCQK